MKLMPSFDKDIKRVVCVAGWFLIPSVARVAFRAGESPECQNHFIGFRIYLGTR